MADKYPCGVIQDLLPLYHDNVCGEESRVMVEEHLRECAECSRILEQLNGSEIEQTLSLEAGAVLKNHQKKEKRNSVIYGLVTAGILLIPVIVCLICNLVIGHALDWFFIVLASLFIVASVTVVPMLASELRFVKSVACGTVSTLLLLFTCCVYTHGNWFWIAAVSVVFGLSVLLTPVFLWQIPLGEPLKSRKVLVTVLWDTAWLLALLAVCCVRTRGSWFWVAAVSVVFGLSMVLAPVVIRQTPLPEPLKNRKTLVTVLWDTAWLLVLLAVCCVHTHGDWFLTAAVPVIFGLSVPLMPVLIRQIPLPKPLCGHKGLMVMTWDTLWLYGILFSSAKYGGDFYWHNALLITTWCLLFPWAFFVVGRYSRMHPLTKSGLVIGLTGAFLSTINDVIRWILLPSETIYGPSIFQADLFNWVGYPQIHSNVSLLTLIGTAAIGIALMVWGWIAGRKNRIS